MVSLKINYLRNQIINFYCTFIYQVLGDNEQYLLIKNLKAMTMENNETGV